MTGRRQLQPERFDERRLADARHAGDADPVSVAAVGQEVVEQARRVGAVCRQGRLDQGDRPPDGGAVAGEDTSGEIGGHPATLPMMRPMIRHHVLITLDDDAPEGVADQIVAELAAYAETCPHPSSYYVSADLGLSDGTADVAIVADFDDVAAFQAYAGDEPHLEIIQRIIAPQRQTDRAGPDGVLTLGLRAGAGALR